MFDDQQQSETTGNSLKVQAPASRFQSTDQLLAEIPVSRRTLFTWREQGLIPYIKIGRRVLFDAESVRQALRRQERGGHAA